MICSNVRVSLPFAPGTFGYYIVYLHTIHVIMFFKKFYVFKNMSEERVGKVFEEYKTYTEKDIVGHGGFGKVYKITSELVVKEEFKVIFVKV